MHGAFSKVLCTSASNSVHQLQLCTWCIFKTMFFHFVRVLVEYTNSNNVEPLMCAKGATPPLASLIACTTGNHVISPCSSGISTDPSRSTARKPGGLLSFAKFSFHAEAPLKICKCMSTKATRNSSNWAWPCSQYWAWPCPLVFLSAYCEGLMGSGQN